MIRKRWMPAAVVGALVLSVPMVFASRPTSAAPVDIVFTNYNIYGPCGTAHDALSIGANSSDYPDVAVSDWEYSLDDGLTWSPYHPIEYATPIGAHPKFGGESHYILTQGSTAVHFRATGTSGNEYHGVIAMPADQPECGEDPDYSALLAMVGGSLTDGPGIEGDSFVLPSLVLGDTAFYNESIVVQRADDTWILWTPDVPMTLTSLGYGPHNAEPGGNVVVRLARAGGADERADLAGAQYLNQAANTPGVDYWRDIRFGYAHLVFTNMAPVGADDAAGTESNTAVTIDVLANDPSRDELSLLSVTAPANGTATIVDDSVVYTPNDGFAGVDTFTYTAENTAGQRITRTVTVTVGNVTATTSSTSTTAPSGTVVPSTAPSTTAPTTTAAPTAVPPTTSFPTTGAPTTAGGKGGTPSSVITGRIDTGATANLARTGTDAPLIVLTGALSTSVGAVSLALVRRRG